MYDVPTEINGILYSKDAYDSSLANAPVVNTLRLLETESSL